MDIVLGQFSKVRSMRKARLNAYVSMNVFKIEQELRDRSRLL